ncbi:MAG: metalloprotease [Patiriisocius sp.]|uniref:metalloprotease n=1 Tax=Patiriisocius sp. TaxID=2822396 RepID=UPI003EF653D9
MKHFYHILSIVLVATTSLWSQHNITIDATLDTTNHTIKIAQEIEFVNTSTQKLDTIYFNDWANSFSHKKTPLGIRFAENYDFPFHFENDEDRGRTTINSVTNKGGSNLVWEYGSAVDILKVIPTASIAPGASEIFKFDYTVKIPDDKFTRFGVDNDGNYKLRYWYISPAVFDGEWKAFSNKNTQDLYTLPSNFNVTFTIPQGLQFTSNLDVVDETTLNGFSTFSLKSSQRIKAEVFINKEPLFESIVTDEVEVVTNIYQRKVTPPIRALMVDRVVRYLDEKLGDYPFDKIVVSDEDNRNNPVYGLNQLPSFLSPFPDGFEYDLAQFKTMSREYIENTLLLNKRDESWLAGAIQIYLMMDYVDTYYPNMKILGSLSDFWIIKWSHVSELEFNDQYPLLYMNMARNNIHQPLATPRDSLIKFNKNIANDYYGGKGLEYLKDFLSDDALGESVKAYYDAYKLKPTTVSDFRTIISQNTDKDISWFFGDYINERATIDFKIKRIKKRGDSLDVTILNKRNTVMPVSVYGVNKDSVLFKRWTSPIDSIATITVPSEGIRSLELNRDGEIAEFNRRNNTKKVSGLFNRPLQFRLFQDAEDHRYNQLFFMPIFEYNLYDGFTTGMKLYNKTLLPKNIHYKLEPQYGYRSKKLIGNGNIQYTNQFESGRLNAMRYGFSGSYYSYDDDLFYRRFTPYMTFAFRNEDLRDNENQYINLRAVNVYRDENVNDPDQEPNYSVFNAQYVYSNPNLINYFRGVVDYQISSKFSKASVTFDYRKLFVNNRQLNVRLFAGAFLFNDTREREDFFSFSLDRPTDYLFDYTYYGRSEDTGIFSQQVIVAEGGFKSQLEPAFSNNWITTINASTNIWRWILVYGDAGLVNNTQSGTKAVFDSGIRINLVQDYFELYFPLYSNLGWEPGLPNYDQKIRFTVTLSPKTLLGLFTREWY